MHDVDTRTEFPISPPIDIPADIRQRLIVSLDSWNFEPHKLPDEEVLCCTMLLFEVLFRIEGMDNDIGIPLSTYRAFCRIYAQRLSRTDSPSIGVSAASTYHLSVAEFVPQFPACFGCTASHSDVSACRWQSPAGVHIITRCRADMAARQSRRKQPLDILHGQSRYLRTIYRCHRT